MLQKKKTQSTENTTFLLEVKLKRDYINHEAIFKKTKQNLNQDFGLKTIFRVTFRYFSITLCKHSDFCNTRGHFPSGCVTCLFWDRFSRQQSYLAWWPKLEELGVEIEAAAAAAAALKHEEMPVSWEPTNGKKM